MASELAGKVAIVTGAARGQGASHARRLVAEGARVLLTDILDDEGETVASELGESGAYLHQDVANETRWAEIVDEAERRWGRLDILINNAGIVHRARIDELELEAFHAVLETNVTGTFLGIRAAAAALGRTGAGAIVNVSSIAGLRGIPNTGAYSASKWAVRGMTKVAAVDLAPLGIRVNAVLPGIIDTPMVRMGGRTDDEILNRHLSRLPIKRMGSTSDVTEAVLFLASERSGYLTGADLVVDGGWTLY